MSGEYKDAFHAWFYRHYNDNPIEGAAYLYTLAKHGGRENVVWSLLERTGDKRYTQETFIKASKLAIVETFDPEETLESESDSAEDLISAAFDMAKDHRKYGE